MWNFVARYETTAMHNNNLEALAMNNGWTTFVVLLLRNPHLLKSRQRSQNRTADPDRVLALRWSNNFDLHCAKINYIGKECLTNKGYHGENVWRGEIENFLGTVRKLWQIL